ncbi:DUF2306 domain-containing protein [Pusillimonas sp. MFBS29]|uniref:DUF2306 domain-containing protein n=1 Tax=Pusillimonas sp. MFBS29 TaxID=2886690 RepID=UPI001D126628|nr:DUF2306 domain-containing protein [Pusillimonas sp. MFBS29]MCC2597479.1 DUF2306 domain-containing protein [Pusillimonas sp. MFBS29]
MSLAPLTSASAVIQLHAWTAIIALGLAVFMMLRRKGTVTHRWVGRFWLVVMLVTVISSFYIHELQTWGPWSPIHILSLITLVLLLRAYFAIRQRKVMQHAELMKVAFYNALLLATFFTFLPGRIMHDVVFGPSAAGSTDSAIPLWVWIVVGVAVVLGGRHLASAIIRKRHTGLPEGQGE